MSSKTGDLADCCLNRYAKKPRLSVSTANGAYLAILMLLLGMLSPGCGPPDKKYPKSLLSARTEERIAAIKYAGKTEDHSVVGILVQALEEEDPAVRFFASRSLQKITGKNFGYKYYASDRERARAVKRWRRYLRRHKKTKANNNGKTGQSTLPVDKQPHGTSI
jgi:hypothetical protein